MRNGLPKGWTTVPINEVVKDMQPGFASGKKKVEGGIAHLRMNNVGLNGELVLDLIRTVPEKLAKPRHYLRPGDVLVCTTNSGKLVGKCTLFNLSDRYAFSNHLTRLRPNSDVIDGRFLCWNLWLRWKTGFFDDKCKHWVNQSTIPKEVLLGTEVVVPPLPEQRRIVAKLEKLLGKVDACQQRLATLPALLKRFRQAVLAAACSGRLTADWRKNLVSQEDATSEGDVEGLPAGWESVCVGDIIEDLKYGTAQKCSYEKRGVPVLRIPNVANGTIDHSDLKYAELSPKELGQLRLHPGDILLIRSNGSVSLVGRCALVREQERSFAYAGYLIRIRPRYTIAEPEFLNLALSSYDVRLQIELEARSTSGVNNINGEEIRALRLSLPPLAEQKEIVQRVEALFALAGQIEVRCTRAKAHADNLTQSILAKAFRGELVRADLPSAS